MLRKICPKCGRETDLFIEKFCIDCFRKEFEKSLKIPEVQTIYVCKYCGKYSFSKKFLFNTIEEAIDHYVKHSEHLKVNADINYELNYPELFLKFYKDNLLILEKNIKIKEKPFTCKFCAMKNSGYKQAILQLRFDVSDELLQEIENYVNNRNQTDFLSFISKIERKKDGIDLYIGSKKVAYEILKLISRKFQIEYKVTRTLVGVKEGKRLYLDTILIRKI
ncbi:MAG: NMD3-related protein [Candidatus Aenigmatarchaeota archaeon]